MGFAVFTPMFQNVDSTKNYSIQDIVPVQGFEGWGGEGIQVLDSVGNVSESYLWLNENNFGKAGWYKGTEYAERTIAPGESFLINNQTSDKYALQFAGQVNYTATSLSAGLGFVVAGNATPVDISIQKFVPVSGFEGWGGEGIQFLDEVGNVVESYLWLNENNFGKAGWYKGTVYADRVVKAGEGFLINNQTGPFSITIPAVEK